jgi:tetratricopeptide (TPR) repeat protein
MTDRKKTKTYLLAGLGLLAAAVLAGIAVAAQRWHQPLSAPGIISSWSWNSTALTTIQSVMAGDRAGLIRAEKNLKSTQEDDCKVPWYLGMVSEALGDMVMRDHYREKALVCSPAYIDLVKRVSPDDRHLAEIAVQRHPESAEGWFWLGGAFFSAQPELAVYAYRQGLARQPYNSFAWVQMGRAFRSMEPEAALSIYEVLDLAQITASRPDLRSEAQFVMGAALSKSLPARAIQLYRQGLEGKPRDGVRWYELGDLLRDSDPQVAIEAYLQSCYLGDPGKHGCYGAGRAAEAMGDIQAAIGYYRLSRWEGALDRADELEKGLP